MLRQKMQFFLEELDERVEEIEKLLTVIEHQPDNPNVIQRLMSILHGIKGSAGIAKLDKVASVAHELEDLYLLALQKKLNLTEEIIDLTFAAINAIDNYARIKLKNVSPKFDIEDVIRAGIVELTPEEAERLSEEIQRERGIYG